MPQMTKEKNQKATTCNLLDLETLRPQLVMRVQKSPHPDNVSKVIYSNSQDVTILIPYTCATHALSLLGLIQTLV